ncbi:MAG TPA: hypothetical protein VG273_01175 [Bryobacteraceae bacterium]|nr:hypothetical protein [Bryobacteraceae bacterium]
MPYDAPSWAMTAALYAGRPKAGYFKVSDPGAFVVKGDGALAFTPQAGGKHQLLSLDPDQQGKDPR